MPQQLFKKGANGKYSNVNPKSWTEAIKDKNTGQNLVEILQGFNMYFLSYTGDKESTRCLVPNLLRKKGLWITYVDYDGIVYTEWYAANSIKDDSWENSSNWREGSNMLVGDISISSNGNWVINGKETSYKAIGERGYTPILRVGSNNKLQVSYDEGYTYSNVSEDNIITQFKVIDNRLNSSTDLGKTWNPVSDYIASWIRWQATEADSQSNNLGRLQISRDNKTWNTLSGDIIKNLHISKYIGADDTLPTTGIPEGTIYAKGPTYAEDDTLNENPIYRLWVYAWKNDVLAWVDNGEFTSIAAGIVQETGDSEVAVMSQKAVSKKINELGLKANEFNPNTFYATDNKRIIYTGAIETNSDFILTPKIPCKLGDVIKWYSGKTEDDYTTSIAFFNSLNELVDYQSVGNGSEKIINLTKETAYLRASIYKPANNGYVNINEVYVYTYNQESKTSSEYMADYIKKQTINDNNDAVFIPYYGTYVDVKETEITLPKYSRVYYGESKVYMLSDTVVVSRDKWQNTEIVLYNSSNNTFRCYTSNVYEAEIGENEHILFTLKKGLDGCSLSNDYVRYDGKQRYVIKEDLKSLESLKVITRVSEISDNSYIVYDEESDLGYSFKKDGNWFVTYKIPCKEGDKIAWKSGYGDSNYWISLFTIDEEGKKTEYTSVGSGAERVFTAPAGTTHAIASIYKPAKSGYVKINGDYVFADDGTVASFADSVESIVNESLSETNIDGTDKNLEGFLYNALKVSSIASTSKDVEGIVSLLMFSDLHGNMRGLNRIVKFKDKYKNIVTDAIHLGDVTAAYYSDNNVWNDVEGAEHIMNVIGNHDCWIQGETWPYPYSATSEQVYQTIMVGNDSSNPFIANWGVNYTENKCYYTKDYESANVRLVVLDCLHYDSEQESWFIAQLNDALSNNRHVVCATHYQSITGQTKPDMGGWNSFKRTLTNKVPTPDSQIDHRLNESAFVAVDNFINNGGVFVCWMSGHQHFDMTGYVNNHERQLSVVVDTSASYDSYVEEDRTINTKNEDAFNLVSIDTVDGLMRIVRVGCDCDMWMRSKKTICYDYINKNIISYS